MKIKEVCEKTNLTDKAIRYYIREGLIFPEYDENYTGRKNFNFEDTDIERLQQVVVLRKYGFSISRIKALFSTENEAKSIFNDHLAQAELEKNNTEKTFKRLNEISACEFSTVEQLCSLLSDSDCDLCNAPSNDNKTPYNLLYSKNKKAKNLLIVLLVIITALSTAVIGFICNSFYQATSSSVIDISKGFVGIRVVQSDCKSYSDTQGSQIINDIFVDGDYIEASSDFDSVELTKENDTYIINAALSSDMKYVKLYPIYESKKYGDIILYNGTYWLGIDTAEAIELKAEKIYKSKKCKYKYDITITNISTDN